MRTERGTGSMQRRVDGDARMLMSQLIGRSSSISQTTPHERRTNRSAHLQMAVRKQKGATDENGDGE